MKLFQNVFFGQYIPINSIIHKLDPRVKITFLFAFSLFTLFGKNFNHYIIPTIILFLIIFLSKIPLKCTLKNIIALKYLFIITWIFNILFSEGTNILWNFGIFNITKEGLMQGSLITLRLIYLILGASILTLTTSPIQISDAFEKMLSPLKKIGFPSHEISMMLTVSFRFIPILFMEVDKITKAQMSRGVDFFKGNIAHKINMLIPILIPLFMSTFRRAEDLSLAMEARGYKGDEGRTHFRILEMKLPDYLFISIFIITTITQIVILKKY